MRTFFLILICFCCCLTAGGQTNLITRDSQDGSASVYPANSQGLARAFAELKAGDQLVVPGGDYEESTVDGLVISQADVSVRGAGYDTVAANFGLPTRITGEGQTIEIQAENVEIEGLRIHRIHVGSDDALITRCEIDYFTQPAGAEGTHTVRECIIYKYWSFTPSLNTTFANCLFLEGHRMQDCIVENCVFFELNSNASGHTVSGGANSITNSVFIKAPNVDNGFFKNANIISSNLFAGVASGNPEIPGDNYFAPNLELGDLFVSVPAFEHNWENDYQLQPQIENEYPGSDATPVGLYGGLTPWKTGGAPFAPRVIENNTSDTAVGGELLLDVTVEAQQN